MKPQKLTTKQIECLKELAKPASFAVNIVNPMTADEGWFLPSIRKMRTPQVRVLIGERATSGNSDRC